MSKPAQTSTPSALSGLEGLMASGFDDFLSADSAAGVEVDLDDIAVVDQVRPEDEFEDEEQTLEDLGKSLRKRQIQLLILRPNPLVATDPISDVPPYELVVGGRRVRAARVEGLTALRAEIRDLTDEEVEEIQLAENIHRKNLSTRAEAVRIKRDVERIGTEATLEKYSKSKSWLSKVLSILDLPEQTDRLITEKVSSDVEVINMVKQVERIDPEAAKEVVEELKAGKGQVNQREVAKAAKDKVKPSNKTPKKPPQSAPKPANQENVATPQDLSHQEHGPVTSVPPATLANDPALLALQSTFVAGASEEGDDPFTQDDAQDSEGDKASSLDTGKVPALPPVAALDKAYTEIAEYGADPKALIAGMPAQERDDVENWLHSFYEAGVSAENLANVVIQGLRSLQFSDKGHGAFALAAFLSGGEEGVKFNMLNIFGFMKS
jgi:ParB family transcriptional regulator, chromosome partitioning protein